MVKNLAYTFIASTPSEGNNHPFKPSNISESQSTNLNLDQKESTQPEIKEQIQDQESDLEAKWNYYQFMVKRRKRKPGQIKTNLQRSILKKLKKEKPFSQLDYKKKIQKIVRSKIHKAGVKFLRNSAAPWFEFNCSAKNDRPTAKFFSRNLKKKNYCLLESKRLHKSSFEAVNRLRRIKSEFEYRIGDLDLKFDLIVSEWSKVLLQEMVQK